MPPLQRLDEAMGVRHRRRSEGGAASLGADAAGPTPAGRVERQAGSSAKRGKVLRTYKWSQFYGNDEVTEFDEAHFSAEGVFSQNSSEGHKEYQDRLRAVHLRKEGMSKEEIATALGRSKNFVAKWWQKDQKEIPRPWGVHEYLTKDMGVKSNGVGATNGATMTEDSVQGTATWWRDVEVRRKYAEDPLIYDEILQNTEWKPTNARTRDFATGAFHMKYDQRGNIKWEGHQNGKYERGLSPAMDRVLQKLFEEYGIADRTSGVITNWYPDGKGYLGSHRHDCWTALFSFGHERILTIDNTPLLMQDGDLCIFGTQRHGVPIMPEITEGRITLVVFFYPNKMQKQHMWQTITDPETMEASRPLKAMLRNGQLGAAADSKAMESSQEVLALQELGFARADVEAALRTKGFDLEQALELLLLAGAGTHSSEVKMHVGPSTAACAGLPTVDGSVSAAGRGGRFRKPRADSAAASASSASSSSSCSSTAAPGSTTHSAGSSASACGSSANSSAGASDELLALRLQFEEAGDSLGAGPAGLGTTMSDEEVAALALQLDELESEQQADPAMLAAQFQEYEAMLTLEDAERWNGQGDLMHSAFTREHLSIEQMEKVTVYSAGHGNMLEKDFWEILQCNSIRVLYDIRQTDYRGELYTQHQRFSVASLRAQCRSRGVFYKSMPLGRESAYGTLAHIKTDEGRHTLVEIAWQAKRRRTAFLGKEELWRDDPRQVAAEVLAGAGHTVEHIRSDGSTEQHKAGNDYPDWLVREEDRLKVLEKKRQAGELGRPQKSRVDRSLEVVASRLAKPMEEIDAMQEMRNAANQKELVVAQRKLARFQRITEEQGVLATKVLKNTPNWILEDARKQAEWVAAKKQEKEAAASEECSSMLAPEGDEGAACTSEAPLAVEEKSAGEQSSAVKEEPTRSTWRSRRRTAAALGDAAP